MTEGAPPIPTKLLERKHKWELRSLLASNQALDDVVGMLPSGQLLLVTMLLSGVHSWVSTSIHN